MFDSIINSLKDQVGTSIQSEAGVDSSSVDGIMDVVKSVAGEKVGKEMLGGGLDNVMNLFSNKSNSSGADGLQTSITSGIVSGLVEKMGFSSEKASSITNMIIPALMGLITNKNSETPDDDSSPLTSLFGGGGGLGDIAKKGLGGLF